MTDQEISELREKYPIPFQEICLYNSFVQILGKHPEDYNEEDRKAPWNKIMSFNKIMTKRWSDTSLKKNKTQKLHIYIYMFEPTLNTIQIVLYLG